MCIICGTSLLKKQKQKQKQTTTKKQKFCVSHFKKKFSFEPRVCFNQLICEVFFFSPKPDHELMRDIYFLKTKTF